MLVAASGSSLEGEGALDGLDGNWKFYSTGGHQVTFVVNGVGET